MITKNENGIPVMTPEDHYQLVKEATTTEKIVNAPITWGQFLGAKLDTYTDPFVIAAILSSLANWLALNQPFTIHAIIQAAVLALLAGVDVVKSRSGTSSLQLRLRSMGQINGGK